MGSAGAIFREVRFVIEEGLTHAYVAVDATGNAPIGVQGWHYKAFPASTSILDIVESWRDTSPILWPQKAPDAPAKE